MILAKEKISQMPQQTTQAKPKKRVRSVKKTKLNPQALVVTVALIAFVVGILFTARYAQLAVTGYKVDKIKQQMVGLEVENQKLALQVEKLKSLERIEQLAMTELGMVKPEGVRFISVEDTSVAKNNAVAQVEKAGTKVAQQEVGTTDQAGKATNPVMQSIMQLVQRAKVIGQAEATSGN